MLELVNPAYGHFKRGPTESFGTKEYPDAKRRDIREARCVMALIDTAVCPVLGALRLEELGVVSSQPVPGEIEADIISALPHPLVFFDGFHLPAQGEELPVT